MRTRFALALLAGAAALGAPCEAAPALLLEGAQPLERTLVLEVWLNGETRHATVELRESNGDLTIALADLATVGLIAVEKDAKPDARISLTKFPGVAVRIDEPAQRLLIDADRTRLAPHVVDLRPKVEAASWGDSEWGAIFDYDLVATLTDVGRRNRSQFAGQTGFTLFSPYAIANTTALGLATPGGPKRLVRLESSVVVDDPTRTTQWIMGDAISSNLRWSRSVRFAGLQVASDFSLQPERAILPLPDVAGEAVVPSAVDVFIGSTRVFSGDIDAGPFRLDNLPVSAGGRDVRIAVRDALGRETIQTLSFYTTNTMLAQGLMSYSAGAGFLRDDYGRESFAYRDLTGQASVRYGWSDDLTLETHVEGAADLILGGLGAVLSIAPIGAVEGAAAVSSTPHGAGFLGAFAVESRQGSFSIFANALYTSPEYADLGALEGSRPDAHRLVLGANLSLGDYGAVGASFVDVGRRHGDLDSRLSVATYSLTFDDAVFVGVTAFHDHIQKETAVEAYLSIPFDSQSQVSGALHADDHGAFYSATYDSFVNPDGGFGYRLTAAGGDNAYSEANATWRANEVTLNGGVAVRDDVVGARVAASGAFVGVDSSIYAARRTDGAFALVKSGEENVRVYRENREVARTDANGERLLSDLPPYLTNRIAVEPQDYPMSATIGANEAKVKPRRRSVAIVDLRPVTMYGFIIELRLPDGGAPQPGAPVFMGTQTLVVGHDGEVFVPDSSLGPTGVVKDQSGVCRFVVAAPEPTADGVMPRIGPVICEAEKG